MAEKFAAMLAEGGTSNSLGRTEEVVSIVLGDESRLEELYQCLFLDDAWVRMRAIDALEKVCRVQPGWLKSYTDRLFNDFADDQQASIQWHLAQLFDQLDLTPVQQNKAAAWLTKHLETTATDWIVAANCMITLSHYVEKGYYSKSRLIPLLQTQQKHHSKAVVRRATKMRNTLSYS